MPSRIGKITKANDFSYIYRKGQRIVGPLFVVRYARIMRPDTKSAVVASVKQVGKATQRNRARRRIWQAIQRQRRVFPPTGYMIAFILKRSVVMAPWNDLLIAVNEVAKRLR